MAQPPPVGESPEKTSWPELVGVPAKEARLTIELERPELRVQVGWCRVLKHFNWLSSRGSVEGLQQLQPTRCHGLVVVGGSYQAYSTPLHTHSQPPASVQKDQAD